MPIKQIIGAKCSGLTLFSVMEKKDKWEKRLIVSHWEKIYIDNFRDFYTEYPNPKPINISNLFNGALTCLFCKYWEICSGHICWCELEEMELYDECWGDFLD